MNRPILKGLALLAGVFICIWFYKKEDTCDCIKRISYENIDVNKGINLDSLYLPADNMELEDIQKHWRNFDLSSDSFRIVKSFDYFTNRKCLILEHYAEGRKHYGGVILPYNYKENESYPLLNFVQGLDQRRPSVSINQGYLKYLAENLSDYFVLVPSYRGQALVVNRDRYCSDGFFGDAFDGATDDALRLMELVKSQYRNIDTRRIAVCGGSRGGTVALLMGARDTSINALVSKAGPVDFFLKEVYHRYRTQYKYQFLGKQQAFPEIRAKMLKSSPIYFIENYPNNLLLLHGEKDPIVPVANARRVIEKLEGRSNFEYEILDTGHQIDERWRVLEWLKKNN